jgi:hypothetical protein
MVLSQIGIIYVLAVLLLLSNWACMLNNSTAVSRSVQRDRQSCHEDKRPKSVIALRCLSQDSSKNFRGRNCD